MIDAAHGGEGWQPRDGSLPEELGTIWADIGSFNEYGVLQKILLHRPGKEIDDIDDPIKVLFTKPITPRLAREQHDQLAEAYKSFGIDVLYLRDTYCNKPNLYFVRDLYTMTPQGAILSRPASEIRAGEERIVAENLIAHGVPIIFSVHSDGVFEGPDLVFIKETVALVGHGIRSNKTGVSQISQLLDGMGIQPIQIQTTYGCGHLDGVLNIVDKDKAVVYPTRISYAAYDTLKGFGYEIIEITDHREAEAGMAINMVALAPSVVLMPAGNPNTRRLLESHDIECHEVDVSELMKGGGAVHCMTNVLKREKG